MNSWNSMRDDCNTRKCAIPSGIKGDKGGIKVPVLRFLGIKVPVLRFFA
jgi:hypothetical protein